MAHEHRRGGGLPRWRIAGHGRDAAGGDRGPGGRARRVPAGGRRAGPARVGPDQGHTAGRPDGAALRARTGLDRSGAERRAEQRPDRRAGEHRCLRHLVPAGAGIGRSRPAAGPGRDPRHRSTHDPRPAVHGADPRPAPRLHRRPGARHHGAALRRGALAERVLPGHAGRPGHAQDVRAEPGAGRHHPRHQPALRRHDHGGPADRVPDVARARMGRGGRGGPRRSRDQPAADGRLDRVRPRAGGAHHRARVLPAAAHPGDALPLGRRRPGGRRARVRDPRRAVRVARGARRGRRGRHGTCGRHGRCRRRVCRRRPGPDRRRDPVRGRVVHLPGPNGAGPRPAGPAHPACRRGRAGRRDGSRKVDAGEPAAAVHRARRRRHPRRRHAAGGDRSVGLAGTPDLGPAAAAPVPRHGRGHHPAGPTRRHGRGGGRGRPGGRRGRVHRDPSRPGTPRRSGRTACG